MTFVFMCPDCGKPMLLTKVDCEDGCARRALSGAEVEAIGDTHRDGMPPTMRVLGRLIATCTASMTRVGELGAEVLLSGERNGLLEAELAKVRQQLGALSPQSAYTETGVQMACVVAVDGKLQMNVGHEPWYDVKLQVPNHPSITCCLCRLCGVIYKPD